MMALLPFRLRKVRRLCRLERAGIYGKIEKKLPKRTIGNRNQYSG
jgi:hypothetical protein